jgi:hypothetical protein
MSGTPVKASAKPRGQNIMATKRRKPRTNHPWRNSPVSPSRIKLGVADHNEYIAEQAERCRKQKLKRTFQMP